MKPLYGDWNTTPAKECMQTGELIDRETLYHFTANAGNQTSYMIQMSEVADVIAGLPLFDTIHKPHSNAPWMYAGQCYAGKTVNRNPALMPMIYICSRYRASSRVELERNIEVAKWMCRQVAEGGGIPIAPHLYFPRFVDDDMEAERYYGMGAGKRLMDNCVSFHVLTVDGIISDGMKEEIEYMTGTLLLDGSTSDLTMKEAEEIVLNRLER